MLTDEHSTGDHIRSISVENCQKQLTASKEEQREEANAANRPLIKQRSHRPICKIIDNGLEKSHKSKQTKSSTPAVTVTAIVPATTKIENESKLKPNATNHHHHPSSSSNSNININSSNSNGSSKIPIPVDSTLKKKIDFFENKSSRPAALTPIAHGKSTPHGVSGLERTASDRSNKTKAAEIKAANWRH